MKETTAQREAVRDIEAICRIDIDSRQLRERIVSRLARLFPHDAFCFGAIDPTTLLVTDDVSRGIPAALTVAAAHNEYLVDDVLKFASLARSGQTADTLGAATGGEPETSHRYRAVLTAFDARHELRAVFVADGRCWGGIALFRGASRPDFSAADVATMKRLSAPIAVGLRRAAHRRGEPSLGARRGTGLLVLDRDLQLMTKNQVADDWLDEFAEPAGSTLPIAVLEVAARGRGAGLPANGRIRGRSGRWLTLQASPLTGDHAGQIAVMIHPTPASDVAEILLLAYGLTEREQQIVRHVMAGRPSRAIATELGITATTVQDHLKAIFVKTGVRSRGELVARILDHRLSEDNGSLGSVGAGLS